VVGSRFLSPQTFLQFGHYFVKTPTICFIYFLVLKCNILVSRFGVYDIINWFRDADCWWISHESSTEIYMGPELAQEGQTVLPRLACMALTICIILSLNLHTLLICYSILPLQLPLNT
jgi:hypothetical protein